MDTRKPKKIIVVGAGVSGAVTANELANKLKLDPSDITILESRDQVGGKLKTFHHPDNPNLVTEYGAGVLIHNYPVVQYFKKKNIHFEKLLPTDRNTVEFYNEIMERSLANQFTYASDFVWQNIKFAPEVWRYNRAVDNLDPNPPQDQELPLDQYFSKNHMDKIAVFLKFLWPGFGYGPYKDLNNYGFRGLKYMGYTTMLSIAADNLVAVHGGYQQLVEKMLEGFNVQTAAHIQQIKRNERGVQVDYEKEGIIYHEEADMLVLACSPYFWKDLGMELTQAERACVDQLSYYRYPVAICRIKGLDPKQLFFLEGLEEKGYGHPAFLFTRDKRQHFNEGDGRLCTIYINLPEGKNDYDLSPGSKYYQALEKDLKNIPGVTDVKIDATYIWPDYNPSVPWQIGIALQKDELAQHLNQTLHVGAYLPGSFETVGAVSEYAIKAVDRWLGIKDSHARKSLANLRRAYEFFTMPREKPIDDELFSAQPGLRYH